MVDTATPAPTFTLASSETPTVVPMATMVRATPTLIAPLATLMPAPRPTLAPHAPTPTWNGAVLTTVPVIAATSPALDADGGYYDYAAALEIVRLTNEFRVQNGKKPLAIDERLMDIARKRAKEIAGNFSHSGLAAHCGTCGENIAQGFKDINWAFNGWLSSTGHRENILDDVGRIGIGVYYSSRAGYYVQNFE